MNKYKFKGGDLVWVAGGKGSLTETSIVSFIGRIVGPVSDIPILGMTYMVIPDMKIDPNTNRDIFNTEFYPFNAIVVSEICLYPFTEDNGETDLNCNDPNCQNCEK